MRLSIISFTENGIQLSRKIAAEIAKADGVKELAGIEVQVYTKCTAWAMECHDDTPKPQILFVKESVGAWARKQFEKRNVLLFIGACGIAVRAIAPNITDKLQDSPVLVMDEVGRYVIPILSGHVGGANELAVSIAEQVGAEPVITTATDINHKFAVDLFAKRNDLLIVNKDGIARVSAKALTGHSISMSVEPGHKKPDCKLPEEIQLIDYPPLQQVDIVVTSEKKEFDTAILLMPKEYVIGMGCRKGKEVEKIEAFIGYNLKQAGISPVQVAALASIDVKKEEPGLLAWSRKASVPFLTYTAEELSGVKGAFRKSDFVKEKVGVDNVCERAALKACGVEGKLVYEKQAEDGMTIAIAMREWSVDFDEV